VKINPANRGMGFEKITSAEGQKTASKSRTDNTVEQFVPSNAADNDIEITYTKQTIGGVEQTSIAALKEESEKAYESLRRLVIELLEKQGYSVQDVKNEGLKALEIDETTRMEAAALIAEDGPLGIEAVSDRIVDFAIAISGGDKSKLPEIRGAIEEGFRQVKNMLGDLPEISLRTHDLIMEKLDRWEKGEA
jgi:hypothetical protein